MGLKEYSFGTITKANDLDYNGEIWYMENSLNTWLYRNLVWGQNLCEWRVDGKNCFHSLYYNKIIMGPKLTCINNGWNIEIWYGDKIYDSGALKERAFVTVQGINGIYQRYFFTIIKS